MCTHVFKLTHGNGETISFDKLHNKNCEKKLVNSNYVCLLVLSIRVMLDLLLWIVLSVNMALSKLLLLLFSNFDVPSVSHN